MPVSTFIICYIKNNSKSFILHDFIIQIRSDFGENATKQYSVIFYGNPHIHVMGVFMFCCAFLTCNEADMDVRQLAKEP